MQFQPGPAFPGRDARSWLVVNSESIELTRESCAANMPGQRECCPILGSICSMGPVSWYASQSLLDRISALHGEPEIAHRAQTKGTQTQSPTWQHSPDRPTEEGGSSLLVGEPDTKGHYHRQCCQCRCPNSTQSVTLPVLGLFGAAVVCATARTHATEWPGQLKDKQASTGRVAARFERTAAAARNGCVGVICTVYTTRALTHQARFTRFLGE